jgi:hypothetical protein
MPDYAIVVRQLVPTRRLSKQDDRSFNPRGAYQLTASSEEKALDEFHRTNPIATLDEFEITITRLTPS